MRIYAGDLGERAKADKSPVTDADHAAEAIIVAGLRKLTPERPVVAEEEMAAGRVPTLDGGPFWLVDPLDGTKEFIKRNGEFTVNIALIEDGRPTFGIVLAPATDTTVARRPRSSALTRARTAAPSRRSRTRTPPPGGLVACASRSHAIYSDLDIWFRNNGLTVAERDPGGLVTEILPDRRGQGRHLSALRPDQRMGHRRGPGCARGGRRRGRDDRRPDPALRQARLRQSALHSSDQRREMIAEPTAATIAEAAKLLREGGLVAFPTETVYGLGGDATNERAVAAIFEAKGRPQFNPLISHVLDADEAKRYVRWSETADKLARRFWPGPLTLVLPRAPNSAIALLATAGLDTVGDPRAVAFGGAGPDPRRRPADRRALGQSQRRHQPDARRARRRTPWAIG